LIGIGEEKMLSRFLFIICGLLLLTACQPQQRPTVDPLACGPDIETIADTNDYISQAIRATGGYEAWINTKKLELDCVVTFYNADGSYYLTQQHHEIYPWSDSIRISATEPQGKIVWLLSQNKLTPAKAQVQYDIRNMIYAVRAITTAPARFLDKASEVSKPSEPVKVQGLWYYPIELRCTGDETRQATFYQSRDAFLVDIISFTDEKESLLVRGYDYREAKVSGVLLPTRIEVFVATPTGVIQRRLLKIDYYNLK
jgi:hypothetical protein